MGNEGVQKWDENGRDKNIQLSIYFGKWRTDDKDSHILQLETELDDIKNRKSSEKGSHTSETNSNDSRSPQSIKNEIKQIEDFFSVKGNSIETYFWMFFKDEVLCFKPISGDIYDGQDYLKDKNDSFPKTIDAELKFSLKKHKLPEVFANINSYQKYNRITIKIFDGSEEEIAKSLINKKKITIAKDNYFEYLSPIELETLIFLIFNYNNSLCSSFRGGTLKDFDLKVSLSDNLFELQKGDYWIQVKKKDMKRQNPPPDCILIHLGETDISHRCLGKDWLTKIIDQRQDILNWLEKMTFKYDMFDFIWESPNQ